MKNEIEMKWNNERTNEMKVWRKFLSLSFSTRYLLVCNSKSKWLSEENKVGAIENLLDRIHFGLAVLRTLANSTQFVNAWKRFFEWTRESVYVAWWK